MSGDRWGLPNESARDRDEADPFVDGWRVLSDAHPEPVLAGAIDMHVHGYPDVGLDWRMRTDDLTMARLARAYGMRGIVLKSHFWPTMDRALVLNERLAANDFTVFSSVTLNPLVGGVSPMAVEAAAAHGAKVVFMPTWGSANDHAHGGVVRRQVIDKVLPSFAGHLDRCAIRLLDANGKLVGAAREVLAVAHSLSLVVSTGHVSVDESLALAEAAADIGFTKLVFAHPFSPSIRAGLPAMREMAARGAVVEMTQALTLLPQAPVTVAGVHEALSEVGPDRVVLTTDAFFPWLPPHAESFRMYVGQLRAVGCSDDNLRLMVSETPTRLLDILPR